MTTSKRPYRIREVAEMLNLPSSTLRYWGREFGIEPARENGQRRYREADVDMLRTIKSLLYERGLTIEAAKAYIADSSRRRKIWCESTKSAITLLNQLRTPLADSPKGLLIVDAVVEFLNQNRPQNTAQNPSKIK